MSTRGAFGIRKNGIDKVGYNHFDSYPEGLGAEILTWLKNTDMNKLSSLFDKIILLEPNHDFKEVFNWDTHEINSSFTEDSAFLGDSLFCEYAYIINLDDNVLEFYVGFNEDPNAKGRYASLNKKDGLDEFANYYGVVLKKTFQLKECFEGKYTEKDFE